MTCPQCGGTTEDRGDYLECDTCGDLYGDFGYHKDEDINKHERTRGDDTEQSP